VLLLSLTTGLIALLVGFFLWGSIQTHSVQTVRDRIDDWQPTFAGIRWTLIGSVALGGPHINGWLAHSGRVSDHKARQLADLRWRVVGWVVVIELILGQGALVNLTTFVTGTPG
jgi:hypothetical protein